MRKIPRLAALHGMPWNRKVWFAGYPLGIPGKTIEFYRLLLPLLNG